MPDSSPRRRPRSSSAASPPQAAWTSGLLGVRRPHAGPDRPLLGRGARPLLRLQRRRARGRAARRYSVAASAGTSGPARNDARARRLVDALVSSPPFVDTQPPRFAGRAVARARAGSPRCARCAPTSTSWSTARSSTACGHAWLARRELGLSARQSRADRRPHPPHARRARFWRWPTIRLNQINWYALLYAADATVTGNPRLLRHDLRLQIERFVARRAGERPARPATSARGCTSTTCRTCARRARMNIDSAEYANIVASFTREYAQARRAGMRAAVAAPRGGCCGSG